MDLEDISHFLHQSLCKLLWPKAPRCKRHLKLGLGSQASKRRRLPGRALVPSARFCASKCPPAAWAPLLECDLGRVRPRRVGIRVPARAFKGRGQVHQRPCIEVLLDRVPKPGQAGPDAAIFRFSHGWLKKPSRPQGVVHGNRERASAMPMVHADCCAAASCAGLP